jgi:hypothetical protein
LGKQVLDSLYLGVIGITPDMFSPTGDAAQLHGREPSPRNAVERLLEAV